MLQPPRVLAYTDDEEGRSRFANNFPSFITKINAKPFTWRGWNIDEYRVYVIYLESHIKYRELVYEYKLKGESGLPYSITEFLINVIAKRNGVKSNSSRFIIMLFWYYYIFTDTYNYKNRYSYSALNKITVR